MTPACEIYVGGHAWTIGGEPVDLGGARMFSPVHPPPPHAPASALRYMLDSGAFSRRPEARPSHAGALACQLDWEARASDAWGAPVIAEAIVSHDVLIDEVWTGATRVKHRWSVAEAESAVEETVSAADYLSRQRAALAPRRLVLSCQGVDAPQYTRCAERVIAVSEPADWIGLGGWCILGRWRSWLPVWWETLRAVLPLVAASGVTRVHAFGVLWPVALGGLVWLADRYGIAVSCDSTAPLLAAAARDQRKSGARMPYWRDNVDWWRATLAGLRDTPWYREPVTQGRLALEVS